MNPIKLSELVEHFEIASGDMEGTWRAWLDKRDGKIHSFKTQVLGLVEDLEEGADLSHYRDWELVEIAEAVQFNDRWDSSALVPIPDCYEIRVFGIMEDFCEAQKDQRDHFQLQEALRGKGAFRRFKDTVERLGLTQKWYAFRDSTMLDKIRRWCEENEIPYTDESCT